MLEGKKKEGDEDTNAIKKKKKLFFPSFLMDHTQILGKPKLRNPHFMFSCI
jgi:hypothetical protein